MRSQNLLKILVFSAFCLVYAFGVENILAGDMQAAVKLTKDVKKSIRDQKELKFSDTLWVDLDLNGVNEEIVGLQGLIISWDNGDTLKLSENSGPILSFDCNGDSIPDLVQKVDKEWMVYENAALPLLNTRLFPMQEDDSLFIALPNDGLFEGVAFTPTVDKNVMSLEQSDSGLFVVPSPDWHGNANIRLTYSKGIFSDTVDYSIMVMPVNDLPRIVRERPILETPEDVDISMPIDSLLACVEDKDGQDDLKLRLLFGVRNCRRFKNAYVYRPRENWSGKDTLYFWVGDRESHDTLVQYIQVNPVNDAPQWKSITSFRFPEDEYRQFPLEMLYDYASDVESADSLLKIHVFSSEHISISTEGGKVTLIADENWYGTEKLLLTVSDGELKDSTLWKIELTPVNDAPVLSVLPDTMFLEDERLVIAREELEKYAEDVESDAGELKWQIRRLGNIRAHYNGARVRCSAPNNWFGFDSLEVMVSDGELSDSRIWRMNVLSVNDAPAWKRKKTQRSFLEDETLNLNKNELYDLVYDPETSSKDLDWTLLPASHIYFKENESGFTLKADKNWYGNTGLKMIVSDGEYADTMDYRLRVISVNDKPHVSDIPAHSWKEDDTLSISKSYLSKYVTDVETKRSDLMWSYFSDQPGVSVRERQNSITLASAPDWNGSAKIGFVVSDGGLKDTGFMKINVQAVNDPPRWKSFPDTSIAEDGSLALPYDYIRQFVFDPDKEDSLTLSFDAGNNFYLEKKKDLVEIWPYEDWYGKEKFIISVSDGKKTVKKVWNIPVFAVNDAPYFTMELPDSITFYANSSDTLYLDEIVYDIDNKNSELEWEVINGNITYHMYDLKHNAIIFYTENFTSGEDIVSIRISDGYDMITCYIPVNVKEVDRFLMANPVKLELLPNIPNPFQSYTDVRYSLPVGGYVSVKIYDLLGKEIITLANSYHEPQNYSIRWFGETASGMPCPSGVYLCRMSAIIDGEPAIMMRKMMLVR